MLKKGGILIFDDFLWDCFGEKSPIKAINEFLELNKNDNTEICIGYYDIKYLYYKSESDIDIANGINNYF